VDKNFYFLGTIFGLGCSRNSMRQEFAPEAKMSTFHRVDERRAKLGPPTETVSRLPLGQSVVVIAGLSALSWAVLIASFVVLRAIV